MEYQVRFRQIRQKKDEADKMIKVGFPKCFSLRVGKISEHCNTCIKLYRNMLKYKNSNLKSGGEVVSERHK